MFGVRIFDIRAPRHIESRFHANYAEWHLDTAFGSDDLDNRVFIRHQNIPL
jgi:hypothetical protein